jgi:hypothetical protein
MQASFTNLKLGYYTSNRFIVEHIVGETSRVMVTAAGCFATNMAFKNETPSPGAFLP